MNLSELTLDNVKRSAETIVNNAPENFVYTAPVLDEKCVYVYNGEPSCLVGQILADNDFPVSIMETWDDRPNSSITHILAEEPEVDIQVIKYLRVLQIKQDGCDTWQTALAEANLIYS